MKFKKIFITSIAALAFFTISSQEVSADEFVSYNNGLFDTETFTTTFEAVVDNTLTSGYSLSKSNSLMLTFEEPQDINHVYFYFLESGYGNSLRFYDESDVLISTIPSNSFNVTNNYLFDVNLDNVKKINIFQSADITPSNQVKEIEVFSSLPDSIPPSVISNLSYVVGEENSVKFSFTNPLDEDFSHLEVYKDDELLTKNLTETTLNVTDLIPEETYVFTFYAVDTSGNKSLATTSTVTMPSGPDLIAPLDIKDLKHVASDSSIQFTYDLPIDPDFSHLMIYRNNVLVGDNVKIASFNDLELEYDTSYQYTFKAVDTSGNISNGYSFTANTMPYNDTIPPDKVISLSVNEGNSSLYASWSPNVESDVAGYNIYVNGVKRNAGIISGTSYSITNLNNGDEYLIQVSAVDTNGNESALSEIKSAFPDKNVLPIIKLDSDLSSVGSSVENWFSEIWLLVAFAIALPLSFIVGNRIKSLFFA